MKERKIEKRKPSQKNGRLVGYKEWRVLVQKFANRYRTRHVRTWFCRVDTCWPQSISMVTRNFRWLQHVWRLATVIRMDVNCEMGNNWAKCVKCGAIFNEFHQFTANVVEGIKTSLTLQLSRCCILCRTGGKTSLGEDNISVVALMEAECCCSDIFFSWLIWIDFIKIRYKDRK